MDSVLEDTRIVSDSRASRLSSEARSWGNRGLNQHNQGWEDNEMIGNLSPGVHYTWYLGRF